MFRSEQCDLLDLTAQIESYEIDKILRIQKIQHDLESDASSGAYRVIYLKERATLLELINNYEKALNTWEQLRVNAEQLVENTFKMRDEDLHKKNEVY